ncbi:MAG: cation:proton antiporter [Patescibacteria group bacterium]
MKKIKKILLFFISIAIISPFVTFANNGEGSGHVDITQTLLWIAIILLSAKIASLVEKIGQPSVLGELMVGVILGNLTLIGIDIFEPIKKDFIIFFLSQLGVIILLFQIGLESEIAKMKKVGLKSLLVAIVGVSVSFIIGTYIIGPLLLPDSNSNAHFFLGATITATSVGITARVFQDLGKLQIKESQIVLGAAVIDDILSLIILAIAIALATAGTIGPGTIIIIATKAIIFLIGSIVLGQLIEKHTNKFFAKIHSGVGMKFTIIISFGLIFSFLAQKMGLAPIIGAFAAGLILDPVHFHYFKDKKIVEDIKNVIKNYKEKDKKELTKVIETHSHRELEDLIEPIGLFLIPIFFVLIGMNVKLSEILNFSVLGTALILTFFAFIGKLSAGLVAGKGVNKLIIGLGMVPRGEVELIFAMTGKNLGLITNQAFSVIVVMVILTTILTPIFLTPLVKKITD